MLFTYCFHMDAIVFKYSTKWNTIPSISFTELLSVSCFINKVVLVHYNPGWVIMNWGGHTPTGCGAKRCFAGKTSAEGTSPLGDPDTRRVEGNH